jgi:hypothetical protein
MKATTMKNWSRVILIIAYLVAPLSFVGWFVHQSYESSHQSIAILHFWIPENAQVFTDKQDWIAALGGEENYRKNAKGVLAIQDYRRDYDTGGGKHFILLTPYQSSYATVRGDDIMVHVNRWTIDKIPASTVPIRYGYIGEGELKVLLERDFFSIFALPAIVGIVYGILADICLWLFLGLFKGRPETDESTLSWRNDVTVFTRDSKKLTVRCWITMTAQEVKNHEHALKEIVTKIRVICSNLDAQQEISFEDKLRDEITAAIPEINSRHDISFREQVITKIEIAEVFSEASATA